MTASRKYHRTEISPPNGRTSLFRIVLITLNVYYVKDRANRWNQNCKCGSCWRLSLDICSAQDSHRKITCTLAKDLRADFTLSTFSLIFTKNNKRGKHCIRSTLTLFEIDTGAKKCGEGRFTKMHCVPMNSIE